MTPYNYLKILSMLYPSIKFYLELKEKEAKENLHKRNSIPLSIYPMSNNIILQ